MNKYLIAVLFFLLNSSTLFAQRHGRGDAIQVFAESNHNSHLLLQIKNNESRLYVCTSDPKRMPRSSVILTDPITACTQI